MTRHAPGACAGLSTKAIKTGIIKIKRADKVVEFPLVKGAARAQPRLQKGSEKD
jgi:hypothetical protein